MFWYLKTHNINWKTSGIKDEDIEEVNFCLGRGSEKSTEEIRCGICAILHLSWVPRLRMRLWLWRYLFSLLLVTCATLKLSTPLPRVFVARSNPFEINTGYHARRGTMETVAYMALKRRGPLGPYVRNRCVAALSIGTVETMETPSTTTNRTCCCRRHRHLSNHPR